MTPAILLAKKHKIAHKVHEYEHSASDESYGLEAAHKLGIPEQQMFKTLVVMIDGKSMAVGVVPVSGMLNLKSIAKATGGKKAVMANQADVERATGYVLGGVSPLAQKKRLKTVIDSSAKTFVRIFVSAGRRGLDIELNPDDLCRLVNGSFASISQ